MILHYAHRKVVVTVPAGDGDSIVTQLDEGDVLPANVPATDIAHLVSTGLAIAIDVPDPKEAP